MEETRQTVTLSDAELAQFRAFQEAQKVEEAKAAAKQMRRDDREMVDDAIESLMPGLRLVSDNLACHKKMVFDEFAAIIELKNEMFKMDKGCDLDNQSHTFTNSKATMRIVLGHYVTDGYLDTADAGIAKVQEYIQSLASDEKSKALVKMVMHLLAKDTKGTLKAAKIIQLRKMAEESCNESFIEGVKIIEEAYQPQMSRTYLKAYCKDEKSGAWVQIPLGMTEA